VVTKAGPNASSHARAYTANVTISLPGLPVIVAKAVQSDSGSNCSEAVGGTTLAYLSVGSTVLINTFNSPAANTTFDLGVVKITLNEQIPVAGASKGVTVNAIHVTVLNTVLDVVVSSATSDIHNCPTA
jgi:hypothetical protein